VRWAPGAVIQVWIEPAALPLHAGELVAKAMSAWTEAASGRVVLRRTLPGGRRDIRVRFVQSDTNFGETAPRVDRRTGQIVSADVAINRDVAASDELTERIAVYLTALHELGHALGLPHTDDFRTIMYRFRRPDDGERYFAAYRSRLRSADDIGTPAATGLSPDDVRALRELYDR